MTRWLSDDEQHAWRGLLRMTSHLQARLNHDLAGSGLSLADYDVLVTLSETPGGRMRIFELGRQLAWEQSRLSHHLARMQRRELVRRENCASDRRGAFVVLADAGRIAIEQAAPAHVCSVRELIFDHLTPGQVAALDAITSQVLHRLDRQQGGT
ncbi:MAG TPA: MarR family transcriptional regulator [Streptosporangiaceae bacterium]